MRHRAILLVNTNPASEERTDDFNNWYSEVHIPQILERVPGVVAARRYRLDEASPIQPAHRYLAVYEIEADEPASVVGAMKEAADTGSLDSTDALDRSLPMAVALYREI
jgi:hypothetical protein